MFSDPLSVPALDYELSTTGGSLEYRLTDSTDDTRTYTRRASVTSPNAGVRVTTLKLGSYPLKDGQHRFVATVEQTHTPNNPEDGDILKARMTNTLVFTPTDESSVIPNALSEAAAFTRFLTTDSMANLDRIKLGEH